MFYIPLGIFVGTPGLSVGHYIAYSMIPALLGNIVGGGLFVGVVYWYLVSLSLSFDVAAICVLTLSTVPCRGH
jgi:formate/nitrite transporter FocA (FNT family)